MLAVARRPAGPNDGDASVGELVEALVSALDPSVGLAIDAATFVISAVLVRSGVRRRPPPVVASSGVVRASFLASTVAGMRVVWSDPGLRSLIALCWLAGFYVVPEALAAPYASSLAVGAVAVGLVIVTCLTTTTVLEQTGMSTLYRALDAGWAGVGVVALAVGVYFVVGALVTAPGLKKTAEPRSFRTLFGGVGDSALEIATLCLGILTALALATQPAFVLAVVPPMVVLHRAVLVKQLEIAAKTDAKTGLFNVTGWHSVASRELARAQRAPHASFGVPMVDGLVRVRPG